MRVTIQPGRAVGTVAAPPSKSMAHRLLICAALSEGVSHIRGISLNEDICATLDCLRALGAECTLQEDTATVKGVNIFTVRSAGKLCCRESGSTLRFLIPPALLSSTDITFTGAESLFSRPLSVYENLSHTNGFSFEKDGCSLKVGGHLKPAIFSVPGDVSSQFISGLLFALPLLDGDSAILISPPLESRPYIDLTLQALRSFGICAQWVDECTLHIPGNQRYRATDISVEGDWSGAAFFAALNAFGGDAQITGLNPDSLQGDRICQQYLKALQEGCPEIDLSQCPDLGPILFAVAAAKNGARFTGIHRLRLKESDRITAMAQELSAFGVEVTVSENAVVINAKAFHKPDRILCGHNDHRIVMALSILLTLTGGQITDAQAVRKSFPDFFDRLADLGITLQQEESYE